MVTYFLCDSGNKSLNGEVRNAMSLPQSLHAPDYYMKASQFPENRVNTDTYSKKENGHLYGAGGGEEQQLLLQHQHQQNQHKQLDPLPLPVPQPPPPVHHHLHQQQQQRLNSKLQNKPNFMANGGLPNIRENGNGNGHSGGITAEHGGFTTTSTTAPAAVAVVPFQHQLQFQHPHPHPHPVQHQILLQHQHQLQLQHQPVPSVMLREFNIIENPTLGGLRHPQVEQLPPPQHHGSLDLSEMGVGMGVPGGGGDCFMMPRPRDRERDLRTYAPPFNQHGHHPLLHHLHSNPNPNLNPHQSQHHQNPPSSTSLGLGYGHCRESEPLLHASSVAPVAKVSEDAEHLLWSKEILL